MVSYQYAAIHQRKAAIELQITDASTIHHLLDKLAARIEGFGASASKLPGGPYYWRLSGMGEDIEKAWSMIEEHFFTNGWMPLDGQPMMGDNAIRTMCFGLIQQKTSKETIQDPMPCMSLA
jgi:hypothetical protein